jgi:hypothetical protein
MKIHHIILFAIIVIFLPKVGFYFDTIDRPEWIAYMKAHGISNVYGSGSNYLPLGLYILYFFGLFFDSPEGIKTGFYLFKIVVLLFDFAAPLILINAFGGIKNPVKLGSRFQISNGIEYLVLLNPCYLYNTLIWNQQDAIHTAFVVLAVVLVLKNQPVWAAVVALLAVNLKLQSIIFVPVIGIVLLYYVYKKPSLLLRIIPALVITQLFIFSPFIVTGKVSEVLATFKNSVDFFPVVSATAYNFWYLAIKQDPTKIFDSVEVFRLQYKTWGLLLFFGLSVLTMIPLMIKTFVVAKNKLALDKNLFELVFLTSGIIAIIFFFVSTQMHERYSHPAMILFFGFGVLSGRYWLFGLTCLAYLLNVDGVFQSIQQHPYLPIVKPEIVALIFVAILILAFYEIYKGFLAKFTNGFSIWKR